jgi:hypothetical protein
MVVQGFDHGIDWKTGLGSRIYCVLVIAGICFSKVGDLFTPRVALQMLASGLWFL